MCSKLVRIKYKEFITFLKKRNFSNKRNAECISYTKNNIIVKINDNEINFLDIIENRTYNFTTETSTQLLIEFLIFLDKDYQIII